MCWLLAFGAGMLGCTIGVLVMALAAIAKHSDEQLEREQEK